MPEEKAEAKKSFYGREFDWLAVDKDGNIGFFSTAGYGPVPIAFSESNKNQDAALDYVRKLPKSTFSVPLKISGGDYSDWFNMARRGIYSYDFRPWRGPYKQLARPARNPLMADSLPEDIRAEIQQIAFDEISFKRRLTIKPSDHGSVFEKPS